MSFSMTRGLPIILFSSQSNLPADKFPTEHFAIDYGSHQVQILSEENREHRAEDTTATATTTNFNLYLSLTIDENCGTRLRSLHSIDGSFSVSARIKLPGGHTRRSGAEQPTDRDEEDGKQPMQFYNSSSIVKKSGQKSQGLQDSTGIITAFYTTSEEGSKVQDEVDFEFLGKDPHHVQTNYYVNGVGGHEVIVPMPSLSIPLRVAKEGTDDAQQSCQTSSGRENLDKEREFSLFTIVVIRESTTESNIGNSSACQGGPASPPLGARRVTYPAPTSTIRWLIDDHLVREERGVRLTKPQALHISIWDGTTIAPEWSGAPVDWPSGPFTALFRDIKISKLQ